MKRLTGGDTLTGRFMRGDYFDFAPTAKFALLTNHRPRLKGTDLGIRRRVQLVPFNVTIPEDRRDPTLRDTILKTEGPGVLRWIVEGARDWYDRGEKLEPPPAVRAATDDYHAQEDVFARFLDERCTLRPPTERPERVRTRPRELFAAFRDWCQENGERDAGSERGMGERLAALGYVVSKSNGVRWYRGVGLNPRDARDAGAGPPSGTDREGRTGTLDPRDPDRGRLFDRAREEDEP